MYIVQTIVLYTVFNKIYTIKIFNKKRNNICVMRIKGDKLRNIQTKLTTSGIKTIIFNSKTHDLKSI